MSREGTRSRGAKKEPTLAKVLQMGERSERDHIYAALKRGEAMALEMLEASVWELLGAIAFKQKVTKAANKVGDVVDSLRAIRETIERLTEEHSDQ